MKSPATRFLANVGECPELRGNNYLRVEVSQLIKDPESKVSCRKRKLGGMRMESNYFALAFSLTWPSVISTEYSTSLQ
jgi:hypothetical protein